MRIQTKQLTGWIFLAMVMITIFVGIHPLNIQAKDIEAIKKEVQVVVTDESLAEKRDQLLTNATDIIKKVKQTDESINQGLVKVVDNLTQEQTEWLTTHTIKQTGNLPTPRLKDLPIYLPQGSKNTLMVIYLDQEGLPMDDSLTQLMEEELEDVYFVGGKIHPIINQLVKEYTHYHYISVGEDTFQDDTYVTTVTQLLTDMHTKYKEAHTVLNNLDVNTVTGSFKTYPTNPKTSRVNYWYGDPAYYALIGREHRGMDIVYLDGSSEIYSVDDGVVEDVLSACVVGGRSCGGGWGNYVRIRHSNGLASLYAHLASVNVTVGQQVQAGQHIGMMGNTGQSDGKHLHFEILQGQTKLNPNTMFDWSNYTQLHSKP